MTQPFGQNEADSLSSTWNDDERESERGATRVGRRVRQYDFRRPDKFSKDQMRTLHMIHENCLRPIQTYFAGRFRSMIQLHIASVDQSTYGEFIRSVSNPSVICPFHMDPLPGTCLLDFPPGLAFPMIDRMMGGPGNMMSPLRPLTEIETALMSGVIRGTMDAYVEAWRSIIEVGVATDSIELNPMFVQVAAPTEIVITVSLEVCIGEVKGLFRICLPHLTLEPIVDKLSAHNWFRSATGGASPDDQAALEAAVSGTKVTVVAELGRVELSIREILDLNVGDVVMLDTLVQDPAIVYVGSQPKLMGRAGRVRGRLAIEIWGDAPKGDEEHEG